MPLGAGLVLALIVLPAAGAHFARFGGERSSGNLEGLVHKADFTVDAWLAAEPGVRPDYSHDPEPWADAVAVRTV